MIVVGNDASIAIFAMYAPKTKILIIHAMNMMSPGRHDGYFMSNISIIPLEMNHTIRMPI